METKAGRKSKIPSREELVQRLYENKTISDAALRYGVSPETIRRWIAKHQIDRKDEQGETDAG